MPGRGKAAGRSGGGMEEMGCELESEFRDANTSDAVAIEGFGWVQGARV